MTITELSQSRVGAEWRFEDHLALCRAIERIEETARGIMRLQQKTNQELAAK